MFTKRQYDLDQPGGSSLTCLRKGERSKKGTGSGFLGSLHSIIRISSMGLGW